MFAFLLKILFLICLNKFKYQQSCHVYFSDEDGFDEEIKEITDKKSGIQVVKEKIYYIYI